MLEGEETKWRLGVEPEQAEERAAELSSEEDERKRNCTKQSTQEQMK